MDLLAGNGALGPLLAACWIYVVLGVFGVALLMVQGWPTRAQWLGAVPYSLFWLASVFTYFFGLALLEGNVVLAVIIQASRGLQSIALGWVLAHMGMTHLEEKVPHRTVLLRALAALLMLGAIALYAVNR